MENVYTLTPTYFVNDLIDQLKINGEKISFGRTNLTPALASMIAEGGIDFYSYLKKLGLNREPNLMVLSSRHHYYYDESDLKNIRTLVNIKKLNLIKSPEAFLNNLIRILPRDAYFIGCFYDSKNSRKNGKSFFQPSKLFNRFVNLLDSRTDRSMNSVEVTKMLESHGFKMIDMTEIDGITYFNAKSVGIPEKVRA
jgi:hypothetical protein